VELADFGAASAVGAERLVHYRQLNANFFARFQFGSEKKRCIGRFHVTIEKANSITSHKRQTGSDRGFAGSAFPAGNDDTH
jgi:hypothetical protein